MATSITLRATKGSALTHAEMDTNLTNLQTTADAAKAASDTLTADKAEATALGVSNTDQNMGSFTGTTISDNVSAKAGMQALETAVETKATAAALGVTASAAHMGTFTGTTIADNQTAKVALQSLETSLETKAPNAFSQATSYTAGTVGHRLKQAVYITDTPYSAVSGTDVVDEIGAALTALGTTDNATLVFPKGTWTIGTNVDWSAYRNVTFVLEPGCTFANSTNTMVFPERVEIGLGVTFTGAGAITVKNDDQLLLSTPPAQYVVAGNEAQGVGALNSVTTGFNNFAWGYKALNSLTAGRSNIAIGVDTLKSVTGGTATSAAGTYMSEGDGNIAIGDMSLRALTTGYENVSVGMYNMYALTTGKWNTCVGVQNLELGTTCEANVVIGSYNLVTFTGNNSVAVGFGIGENSSTGSNTAVGYVAMGAATTANLNTAVGSEALTRITTGTQNVAVGHQAAQTLTTGINNVAIGTNALNAGQTAITNCTAVGNNALLAVTTGDNNTALGSGANNAITTQTNCTALGFNAQCDASNQVTMGDANVTEFRLPGPGFKASLTNFTLNKTSTAAGTTGAQTIQKPAGAVNFAGGATTLVVTNAAVTANSIIIATVATNDATMKTVLVVAGAGSFTIHANAAATAETRVNYLVIN